MVKLRRIVAELAEIDPSAIGVVADVLDSFEQLAEKQWNIASESKRVRVIPVTNRHELLLPNQILVGVERAPEPDTNGRLRHLGERLIVSRRRSDDGGTRDAIKRNRPWILAPDTLALLSDGIELVKDQNETHTDTIQEPFKQK